MKRSKKPRRPTVRELIALAAQPVPLGLGYEILGRGRYAYVKSNRWDGSTRCFRFPDRQAMEEAMRVGMAADLASSPKNNTARLEARGRSPSQAQRELESLLRDPPRAQGLPEPGPRWYRLYTRRIGEHLLRSLDDEGMRTWEVDYTVCHELVAQAWAARPDDPTHLREAEAWAAIDVDVHLACVDAHTLLWTRRARLIATVRDFLAALRDLDAMTSETWERLDREYGSRRDLDRGA